MCGFLSAYSYSDILPKTSVELSAAAHLLQHRGPDDTSSEIYGPYASYFYRLSIRDLTSHSRQPFFTSNNRYLVCFNGEIYSHTFSDLEPDILRSFSSDTQFLSFVLSRYGLDSIKNIIGMFAISIYDCIEDNFYLARDSFGIKPLFYTFLPSSHICSVPIVVASSEQIPLSDLRKSKDIDQLSFFRFISMGVSCDTINTFETTIKSILPGSLYRFNKSTSCFDSVFSYRLPDSGYLRKSFDSQSHFLSIDQIFSSHLISDLPICSTISGGVDSSLVSVISARHSNSQLKAYTIYSDSIPSELDSSSELHSIDNLHISTFHASEEDIFSQSSDLVRRLHQPFASSSWLFQDQLFHHLSVNCGYKVCLVGEGADEFYAGYKRLLFPYIYSACLENTSILPVQLLNEYSSFLGCSEISALNQYNLYIKSLAQQTDYQDFNYSMMFPGFSNRYERYYPLHSSTISPDAFFKQHLYNHIYRSDLPSTLHILDILSMSYGMELRTPFVDIRLAKLLFNIDYKAFFREGFNKFILRSAASCLPDSVRFNRVKKQRPQSHGNRTLPLIYGNLCDLLSTTKLDFIDSSFAINELSLALRDNQKTYDNFWFRMYTALIFADHLGGSQ